VKLFTLIEIYLMYMSIYISQFHTELSYDIIMTLSLCPSPHLYMYSHLYLNLIG